MTALERLRLANQLIGSFLELDVPSVNGDLEPVWNAVQEISARMDSVGELIAERALREGKDKEIDSELQRYRINLAGLRVALGAIEERLLYQRAKLLSRNQHLSAASNWTVTAKRIQ
jgi:hypothetical protein